jgi:hypothetical protein
MSAPAEPKTEATQEDYAEWLAAALSILKLSSAEAELAETKSIKDLIFDFSGTKDKSAFKWDHIVQAEFAMLRELDYNVAVPTSEELAGIIVLDVVAAAQKEHPQWAGLLTEQSQALKPELAMPVSRFSLLVTFLVELGLSHAQDAVYRQGMPPIALAIAAVRLALHAFGDAPAEAAAKLDTIEQDLLGSEAGVLLSSLTSILHRMWASPPDGCRVLKKFESRAAKFAHGPLPLPLEHLCYILDQMDESSLQTPQRTPRRQSPPPTTGPRERPSVAKLDAPKAVSPLEAQQCSANSPTEAVIGQSNDSVASAPPKEASPCKHTWAAYAAAPWDECLSALATLKAPAGPAQPLRKVRKVATASVTTGPSAHLISKIGRTLQEKEKETGRRMSMALGSAQPAELAQMARSVPTKAATSSTNLLRRQRRDEIYCNISPEAELHFSGVWKIYSQSKYKEVGTATISARYGSYLELRDPESKNLVRESLRIDGTGDRHHPFVVNDEIRGKYFLDKQEKDGAEKLTKVVWKHAAQDKSNLWERVGEVHRPPKRGLDDSSNSLRGIHVDRELKRRKVTASSSPGSEERERKCQKANVADKENMPLLQGAAAVGKGEVLTNVSSVDKETVPQNVRRSMLPFGRQVQGAAVKAMKRKRTPPVVPFQVLPVGMCAAN